MVCTYTSNHVSCVPSELIPLITPHQKLMYKRMLLRSETICHFLELYYPNSYDEAWMKLLSLFCVYKLLYVIFINQEYQLHLAGRS